MVNRQNITSAILYPIVTLDLNKQVQADLINIGTKPDGFYVWIFHIKDHFSIHMMLYAHKSQKAYKIAYYISLYVCHFGVSGNFSVQ